MVHYDPVQTTPVQQPSPVCPKCGSHWTEVVGMSHPRVLFIHCLACGERSTVMLSTRRASLASRT